MQMRKVTAGLFYSVDGIAEAPDQWQFDSFDDELGAMLGGVMGEVDTVLMGRQGWQEWAGYWPNAGQDMDFAGFINAMPKHVASHTLKPADMAAWGNSSLIEGDLEAYIRDLKQQPGGTIAVMAGMSLVRQLLVAGLMDELTLIMHPVVAGKGRRLFEDTPTTRLELIRSEITSKGNAVLTYGKKAA
jgi:dihydrofolate reductase